MFVCASRKDRLTAKHSTCTVVTENSKSSSPVERWVFHGTPSESSARCITHQNFDPRVNGRHGTVYGKGAYFAAQASLAHRYTVPAPSGSNRNHRFMYFARIVPGSWAVGSRDLPATATARPSAAARRALRQLRGQHRQTSGVHGFDRDQCYPEFLIEYEADSVDAFPANSAPSWLPVMLR